MSNPWMNVMPGGVPFTPRPEDDDEDWGFGAPGDPVGEADAPATPVAVTPVAVTPVAVTTPTPVAPEAPAAGMPVEVPLVDIPDLSLLDEAPGSVPSPVTSPTHVPVQVPVHAEGFTPHPVLVSTNVDTPVPATPTAPVAPVEETPGWSAWGEWDDEPATPSRPSALDALAPGRWGTPLSDEPAPATPVAVTPAPEAPAVEVPAVEVPPLVPPVAPAPVAPSVEVPAETAPVVQEAPAPAPGHPLPPPHPSVPPVHDPALPAPPAPAVPPLPAFAPNPVPDPAPVAPDAPVVLPAPVLVPEESLPQAAPEAEEGYVPEGYSVNPSTGELTPVVEAPTAPVTVTPVIEAPVAVPPVMETPVVDAPEMAEVPEGHWFNPFTFAIEPKPEADPDAGTEVHPEQPIAPVTHQPVHQPDDEAFPPAAHQVMPPVLHPTPVVPVQVAPPVAVPPVQVVEADNLATPDDDDSDDDGPTSLLAKVESVDELLEAEDDFSDVEEAEAAAEAAAKAEKQRQSRATRPVAVTDRDVAVLQFLARYRMATYPQLAAAFGISYTALRHRMPRLAREGLVVRKTIGKSTYSVWMPTDAGMKVADMDLTLPTLSWATVGHTLGLVDIGIRFESLGEVVVTEREIRAADTRDQPTDRMHQAAEMTGYTGEQARLYIVEMGDGTKQYAHIPDMVLARPPAENGGARSVAIELELNHKPAAQWRKILAAYRNAPHISQVIYFTHQSKVRSGILAAAKEVGAEHMVKVRKFEPSEDSAIPLPGRA